MQTKSVKLVEHALEANRGQVIIYGEDENCEYEITIENHRLDALILTCIDAVRRSDKTR